MRQRQHMAMIACYFNPGKSSSARRREECRFWAYETSDNRINYLHPELLENPS